MHLLISTFTVATDQKNCMFLRNISWVAPLYQDLKSVPTERFVLIPILYLPCTIVINHR